MPAKKTSTISIEKQEEFGLRLFNLVINRVLKKVYFSLDESSRADLEKNITSGDEAAKEEAVKKYIPNFKELFEEQAKKIEEEIKSEIEREI